MHATEIAAIALVLLLAGLAPLAEADHGTSDVEPYTGPAIGLYEEDVHAGHDALGVHHETNVGGAAFTVDHAERVHVTVDDELGDPTSALLQFFDGEDQSLSTAVFCGASEFEIPDHAAGFEVWVGPVNAVLGAPVFGARPPPACPGPATAGTITATWG